MDADLTFDPEKPVFVAGTISPSWNRNGDKRVHSSVVYERLKISNGPSNVPNIRATGSLL